MAGGKDPPLLGGTVLSRIDAVGDIAVIAGAHHERLDGRGYPRGLASEHIGLETRIVTTADIFDALTADRPYRAAMSVSKALAVMRVDVGAAIDPVCFNALEKALAVFFRMTANFPHLRRDARESRPGGLTSFRNPFLRLDCVAGGCRR